MKNIRKPLQQLGCIALLSMAVWACQDDNNSSNSGPMSQQEAQQQSNIAANDNNQMIATTQDAMSVTADAFASQGISDGTSSSGRAIAQHPKDKCSPSITGTFNLNGTDPDSLIYSGTLTIDYGDGSSCTDSTMLRKGKITDDFTFTISRKHGFKTYSTENITFAGYYKDSTTIDGTFIAKATGGSTQSIETQNAKITYTDGTSATWQGMLNFAYDRGQWGKWKDNSIKVTGSWSGTNRAGVTFSGDITKDLVFLYSCDKWHRFRPVSGTIEVKVADVTSTIDYGDGTCDKIYTITSGGTTTEFNFDGTVHT
jgi:hypothetical protein